MNSKKVVIGACILLMVLSGAVSLALFRPVVVMDRDWPDLSVKNEGLSDAVIFRVDGFWYWGGQVAMLINLPQFRQKVAKDDGPVRLFTSEIPLPGARGIREKTCYMKLAIGYSMPHIPVFRFSRLLYFEYNEDQNKWSATENIPPKHRALGSLSVGNVGKIDLKFH